MTITEVVDWLNKHAKLGTEDGAVYFKILGLFQFLREQLEDSFIDYIEQYYEGDIEDVDEAIAYLGDYYDEDMDDEEVIEAAKDMQVAYYTEGDADAYEIINKALEIFE